MIRYAYVLTICAAVLAVVAAGCGAPTPPLEGDLVLGDSGYVRMARPAEGTAGGEAALVRLHVSRGDSRKAIRAAERFMERYEQSPLGEEVMMLAGGSEMARGRYMNAYKWYEKQLSQYPAGEYFDHAIGREFRIAREFLDGRKQLVWGFLPLSATSEAIEMFTRIAEHAPGAKLAEDAMLAIADYYFDGERHSEAVEAYDDYLSLFAKSHRAGYAMLRSARASYAAYRGPAYDDTPLVEADLRFRNVAESFPRTAAEAGVAATLLELADKRAEKDYHTAQFYERVGRPEAAVFYYRQITGGKASQQTPWPGRAEADLARLGRKAADGQ